MGEDLLPRQPEPPRVSHLDHPVHAEARSRQKLVCPFCHDLLGATGNVSCPGETCGATYHKICWKECVDHYGGCAVYGCQGAKSQASAPHAGTLPTVRSELDPAPRRFRSNWRYAAAAIGAFALFGLFGSVVSTGDHGHSRHRAPIAKAPAGTEPAPTTVQEWLRLASKQFEAYDHKGAIASASRAIELSPVPLPQALSLRGIALAHEGDLGRAMADLDRSIELQPNQPDYYHNRAIADELKGDHAACVRDCEKILELAPNYPQAGLIRSKIAEHKAALVAQDR